MNFALVTGPAGSGKSWWAREQADGDSSVVLVSTTGIAAISLGGTTINSLLRYFDTADLIASYKSKVLHSRLRKLRDLGTRHIILDEVSMLSGNQLTVLFDAISAVNAGSNRRIALTLVGDFGQLAPVNEPYAFESPAWPAFAANHTHLTTVHRQTDREFIEALGAVRRGDGEAALSYFGDRLSTAPLSSFEGVMLRGKNVEVDKFNEARLEGLGGKALHFTSTRSGSLRKEWAIIPHNLMLKQHALVMILANKREQGEFKYVNGDLGMLVDQVDGKAVVVLHRSGEEVEVGPVEREHVVGDGGRRTVVGTISYIPLRLAYASTVHKAQGLSLDAVQVDLRDKFFAHAAMSYVALSRARTPGGLRIVGSPQQFKARCVVDPRVRDWL